jgi:hypothetical protein
MVQQKRNISSASIITIQGLPPPKKEKKKKKLVQRKKSISTIQVTFLFSFVLSNRNFEDFEAGNHSCVSGLSALWNDPP